MKVTVRKAYRVQFFVPRGTNTRAVEEIAVSLGDGGYTEHPNATGVWCFDAEPVRVIDVLCSGRSITQLLDFVQEVGHRYMTANPREKCFMAYVGGRVLTIEREGTQ